MSILVWSDFAYKPNVERIYKELERVVGLIEDYKAKHGKLTQTYLDIGIIEDSPCFYFPFVFEDYIDENGNKQSKRDSSNYGVIIRFYWETDAEYNSLTKQWEPSKEEMLNKNK